MSILYEFDEELHNRTMQEIAREEGLAKGREEGMAEGREEGIQSVIRNMLKEKQPPEFISKMTGESVNYVYQVQEEMLSAVGEKSTYGNDTKLED